MNHEQPIDVQEYRTSKLARVAAAAALMTGVFIAGNEAVEFIDDLRTPSYEGVGENITNLTQQRP